MAARPGERIKVQGHTVGAFERWGTIIEARDTGFLVVDWDDGHQSMTLPGGDVRIVTDEGETSEIHLGCKIEMRLTETDHDCEATATLATQLGTFRALGVARRNPLDPVIPMIGEELSIARALRSLAEQIESAAEEALNDNSSSTEEVHLI